MVWDGRSQVDLNVWRDSFQSVNEIQALLARELHHLKVKLQDVQPRGYGSVVNFEIDLEHFPTPHWYYGNDDE